MLKPNTVSTPLRQPFKQQILVSAIGARRVWEGTFFKSDHGSSRSECACVVPHELQWFMDCRPHPLSFHPMPILNVDVIMTVVAHELRKSTTVSIGVRTSSARCQPGSQIRLCANECRFLLGGKVNYTIELLALLHNLIASENELVQFQVHR